MPKKAIFKTLSIHHGYGLFKNHTLKELFTSALLQGPSVITKLIPLINESENNKKRCGL